MDAFYRKPPGVCKECTQARKRERYREGRVTLPPIEVRRERRRESRRKHPERERELRQKYYAELKADPVRYAEYLEKRRMEYRLNQERKGRDLSQVRVLKARMAPMERSVPVDALQEAFRRSEKSAADLARALGMIRPDQESADTSRILRLLGLRSPGFRADRKPSPPKRTIDYDMAVRIANALGVDPTEVGV